jgi:hypothetical protein
MPSMAHALSLSSSHGPLPQLASPPSLSRRSVMSWSRWCRNRSECSARSDSSHCLSSCLSGGALSKHRCESRASLLRERVGCANCRGYASDAAWDTSACMRCLSMHGRRAAPLCRSLCGDQAHANPTVQAPGTPCQQRPGRAADTSKHCLHAAQEAIPQPQFPGLLQRPQAPQPVDCIAEVKLSRRVEALQLLVSTSKCREDGVLRQMANASSMPSPFDPWVCKPHLCAVECHAQVHCPENLRNQ